MQARLAGDQVYVTDDVANADVVVVNTCSFIQDATQESIEAVLQLVEEWLPQGRDRHVVVAGCMVSRYGHDLAESLPEVSAFVPIDEEDALLEVIARLTCGSEVCPPVAHRAATARQTLASEREPVPTVYRTSPGSSAYLKVSDGCHRSCAFCTIPAIRGPYRSTSLELVAAEAERLVETGAREIVLIGQDVTAYGRDLAGAETLADVVRAVARIPGVEWLRLMYVQPDGVTPELLAAMAEHDNVCHYLDMPLQHASRDVLRRMGRKGDAEQFLRLISEIRRVMPDVVLRTTMIAGHPGERRADFSVLEEFLRETCFDYVGVFAYSPEEGTVAAEMPDQVPRRTRLARAQRLRDLCDTIGFARAASRVGTELEVLVEDVEEDGQLVGRWRGQAPEIDGVVYLDRGERSQIVRARIVDSLGYDLEGEVV